MGFRVTPPPPQSNFLPAKYLPETIQFTSKTCFVFPNPKIRGGPYFPPKAHPVAKTQA